MITLFEILWLVISATVERIYGIVDRAWGLIVDALGPMTWALWALALVWVVAMLLTR